jgi:MFS family permease
MIIENGITPNARRLLWAGFTAILAAGMGFAVRGAIFNDWQREFGFTWTQLGLIGGAGFTGFCLGIIIGGLVVDKLGYGKLVAAAFAFHVISAVVTFGAVSGMEMAVAYQFLYWGTFIFAVANGTLEAVSNPLVATLYPNKRTHYLNILHASWPLGLVVGGMIGWFLGGAGVHWKVQLGLFLVPTLLYGWMFFGQQYPRSEASQRGLKLGDMLKDVGILGGLVVCFLLSLFFNDVFAQLLGLFMDEPAATARALAWALGAALLLTLAVITKFSIGHWLLFLLFVAHALVGAVELGTDQWAQNITGNLLTPTEGKILFVFTSMIMFLLRFCADFIERKIGLSPVGLLFTCSILAFLGLNLVSAITAFGPALGALAVYAVGKTFFWPTLLAVASDRFPRTGAIAISIMGGIGMMSAGMIGSPGLGYAKDRFASEELERTDPALYAEFKGESTSKFLIFRSVEPIDGAKLAEAKGKLEEARAELLKQGVKDANAAFAELSEEHRTVLQADIRGDRRTLRADALIPAGMAVIFLIMMIYFRAIGGYKAVHLEGTDAAKAVAPDAAEKISG